MRALCYSAYILVSLLNDITAHTNTSWHCILSIKYTELDEYHGCFYEDGPEACEKEIDDRRDLADVLLLQSELQHR